MVENNKNFEVFPWNQNFETGIAKIDEQHRKLVELINSIAMQSTHATRIEDVDQVLDSMTEYANYHFKTEEEIWFPYFQDDPCFIEHQKTHSTFLECVTKLRQRKINEPLDEVVEDLLQFLIGWLIYHILDNDKQLAITIQAIDSGMSVYDAQEHASKIITDSRLLTNTIVNMYNMLTIRSLHLIKEQAEIKKLTEQLQESEKREKSFSNAIVNSVPGLLYTFNAELKLIRWNKNFHTLLGYEEEELANKDLFSFFPEGVRAEVAEQLEKLKDKNTTQFEAQIQRKDGTLAPFVVTGHILRMEEDSYLTGIGIDSSPLKKVESELRKNRDLYAEAQEIANLGHWSFDLTNNTLIWSDQIYKIFELDPAEFSPSYENFLDVIHPDDKELVDKTYQDSLNNRTPYEIVYRLMMRDGRTKYLRAQGKTLYSEDSKPIRTIGNVQDITKDIRSEQKLSERESELKTALINTITGISRALEARDPYTAGHEQRVADISTRIAERMGLDKALVEGIRLGAIIHDVGKISVPSELLTKPVKLTKPEYMMIQTHARAGYNILEDIKFPWPIQNIVLQHHERLDGSGYPDGLKDGEITLEARIVAVADVFEAMSSHRPYRPSLGIDVAIEELSTNKGVLYDTLVVDTLIELIKEDRDAFEVK